MVLLRVRIVLTVLALISVAKDAERIGDYCKNLFEVGRFYDEGFNVASDVDWQTLSEQEPGDPGPGPNWVIADDFQSDGRPITAVRQHTGL